ncbi:prepilin-type N-terminal cleavage/methylation domain-containing protein [Clostridium sp. BJN0013]|uniref:prepilin-type N-terminal cleavage/methylation domain-containing protein n=1 Tax=Clostridium sp. BJN0013 TaxID=3236840 RepID=UPI0034C6A032
MSYHVCWNSLRGIQILNYIIGKVIKGNVLKKDRILVKKGFTLIEVLCSITVFSILFMTAISIQLNSFKVKKYNKDLYNSILIMEYVKNNIIYNCSYDEILYLNNMNKKYINCNDLNFESIKDDNLVDLFSDVIPGKEPYIVLDVSGKEVLKVNLQFYENMYGSIKVQECEFYKGNYKK